MRSKRCSRTGTVVLISSIQRQTLPPGGYTHELLASKRKRESKNKALKKLLIKV